MSTDPICYVLEALATSIGETPRGGWPWPEVASDPISRATIYKEEAPVDTQEEERALTRRSPWPTPTTLNHTSQKAKTGRPTSGPSRGGPSFGLDDAVQMASKGEWPSASTAESWPTPRAHERQQRNSGDAYIALSLAVQERVPKPPPGPNSDGLWPTPVADGDRTTNYAQGGMSLGAAVRFPTPRAEDGESAGQHKGRGPDTLTAYTKAFPDHETFPTPTVYDATGKGAPRLEQKEGSRHAVSLHHLAGAWASEEDEPRETFPTPTSSMVTVGDMEQARYAGNGGKRPTYEEANQAWDDSEPHETFPTPTVADALGGPGTSGRKGGLNLRTAVDNWPTPKARDYKGTDYSRDGGRRHSGDDLATAVDKRESWPTPKSSDVRHGLPNRIGDGERRSNLNDAAVKWPTPMSADANGVGGAASRKDGRQSMLHHAVKADEGERTWPTPMAGPADVRDGGGHGGVKLATAATEDPEAPRGQLNPDWTEWLMGWPVGWTSLEPLPQAHLDAWDGGMDDRTWWRAEPVGVPRIAVSIPKRVDRLKAIGNGQVPQCAAAAALALAEMFRQVDALATAEAPEELDGLEFLGM